MDVRALAQAAVNADIATLRGASAHLNAWAPQEPVEQPSGDGPLAGLTLAVKDLMAVQGMKSGWGSPERLAEAEPEPETQPVVQAMLDAGARFVGLAQCEELCFSLTGDNAHYGAPVNPAAPDRYAGGSSSGSVSLVASGTVDIATGSDTGGSIRAPASYTGLIGLRATHGRLSLERMMPLAHTYDVPGWFARDAATYAKVARVVFDEGSSHDVNRLIRLDALDAQVLGAPEAEALVAGRERIAAGLGSLETAPAIHSTLDEWYWTFREAQAFEAWMNLRGFVERANPNLGPGVKERIEYGAGITKDRYDARAAQRHGMIAWLEDLLGDDGCLVLPTVPSAAPLKTSTHDDVQAFRERALRLLCLSGNTGLPQITLPVATVHGAPFGVSVIGPRGSDMALVELAERLFSEE